MNTNYPTQVELKEVFEIKNGELWRKSYMDSIGRKYDEKLVENKVNTNKGYCQVVFRGRTVLYHTIIYIIINGDINDSDLVIYHINGAKINNYISNLSLIFQRENTQKKYSHREGKLCGCRFHK